MLVLLFMVLLTVLVVEFSYEMQVEATYAGNQGADLEAYLAAKSAVAQGIGMLAEDLMPPPEDDPGNYDGVFDHVMWYEPRPFQPLNDALMRTSIDDEYGKINLNALLDYSQGQEPVENTVLIEALRLLFIDRNPDLDDPVDAILDWLDYNDDDNVRPFGAERDVYAKAEIPYQPKNGPMDDLEELLLIRGMTPEIYFGDPEKEQLPLSELLTVHGDPYGAINVNTAEIETLGAVIGSVNGSGILDWDAGSQVYEDTRTDRYTDIGQLSGVLGVNNQPGGQQQPGQRQDPPAEKQQRRDPDDDEDDPEGDDPPPVDTRTLYRVDSKAFRIYGDGMQDDIKVRIVAYVYRPRHGEAGTVLAPGSNADPNLNPNAQVPSEPMEPFRIVGWKVIR